MVKIQSIRNPDGYVEFDNEIESLQFYETEYEQQDRKTIRDAFECVIKSRFRRTGSTGRKNLNYILDIAKKHDADLEEVEEIYNKLLKLVKQYEIIIFGRCTALRGKGKGIKDPTNPAVFSHIQPPFLKKYCVERLKIKTDEVINSNQYKFRQPKVRKNKVKLAPSPSAKRNNNNNSYKIFHFKEYNMELFSHNLWKHLNSKEIKAELKRFNVEPKQIQNYIVQRFNECTKAIQNLINKNAYNSTTQEPKINLSQPHGCMAANKPMLFLRCYKPLYQARNRISDGIDTFLRDENLTDHLRHQKFCDFLKNTITEECLRNYALTLFTYRVNWKIRVSWQIQNQNDSRLFNNLIEIANLSKI